MSIDYKKELEKAAKSMILVHDPAVLIKMIVRIMIQKVKVKHAGILLYDKEKNSYVLTVSRGPLGIKIPAGFCRMDLDNPLISFFREGDYQKIFKGAMLTKGAILNALNNNSLSIKREILENILSQMEMFEVIACIPSYFRNELLGILLLGNKLNGEDFSAEDSDFFIALASDVAMAIRNAQLFKELQIELEKEKQLFINTTLALAAAIDAKDHYTHGHTQRVTELSIKIAQKLKEMYKELIDEKFLENLRIASLLHDIGKIGIPENILNKNGTLTDEERKIINQHPLIGENILKPIPELKEVILGIKYHHERYDGTGYPDGLKGDQIPLIAAIIALSDCFDAMITDRPYRKALSKEEAISEILSLDGKQFHPTVISAFLKLYKEGLI